MTQPTITRGARFEHARQLDPTWRPGPGQKYADAPHVIMEITAVRRLAVYYRPVGSTGAGFVGTVFEMGSVVARWLDVESSASRQHFIDTGEYLTLGEAL